MKTQNDSRMYTGTPCDECGGPTLNFASGSIWCPAEDPHAGGHFVVRVAFERAPKNMDDLREKTAKGKPKHRITPQPTGTLVASTTWSAPKPKAKPVNVFGGGMDDFVDSDR